MNQKNMSVRVAATVAVLVVYGWMAAGSVDIPMADCQVSDVNGQTDVGIINGEPDAGYRVWCTVTNRGEDGAIRIEPWLSSSEGEWEREQNLHFETGSSQRFEYFFHEPTINATSIYYGCRCSP